MNTGTTTDNDLALRRRRLKFRAWHRGLREVDLLLGRFADIHVDTIDEAGLAGFETLLEVPDRDILGWIVGEIETPPADDTPILKRIVAFHRGEPS